MLHLCGEGELFFRKIISRPLFDIKYSSTHNTRIERLWVEVGRQFCREWRAFFNRLEHSHMLARDDSRHLWLLHYIFLQDLNEDCQKFVAEWNAHPLSGRKTGNHSPQV